MLVSKEMEKHKPRMQIGGKERGKVGNRWFEILVQLFNLTYKKDGGNQMNVKEAVISVLVNWKDFDRRASRSEFWYFNLATLLLGFIIGFF